MRRSWSAAVSVLVVVAGLATGQGAAASAAPSPVLTGMVDVDAGGASACAVHQDGTVWCWGQNDSGQLGDGTTVGPRAAAPVRNETDTGDLDGVTSVEVGHHHACALLEDGHVRCWGSNGVGQLGDGTDEDRYLPVAVRAGDDSTELTDAVEVSAGAQGACARLESGEVWCWGTGASLVAEPVQLQPATTLVATEVSAGWDHACARLANGQARCWGSDSDGQLGDGAGNPARPFVVLNARGTRPLGGVVHVDAGDFVTCAVVAGGQGRCWGSNRGGRLGYGRFGGPVELPVAVRNVTDTGPVRELRRIDAASYHTCALRGAGRAWCWGGNSLGQLGVGDTTTRPQPVVVRAPNGPGHLERVVDIDVGTFHTCALTADGRVWCWGTNFDGRLGDGTTIERRRPAAVRVAAP